MVQAPFALMAGFALGYLSVKTGTIWTGIIIHLLNNSLSLLVYYMSERFGQEQIALPYTIMLFGFIGIGMISFVYFVNSTKNIGLSRGGSVLSTGEKVRFFFLSPAMILTLAYTVYVTLQYINPAQ
jgi:hypothetical protein